MRRTALAALLLTAWLPLSATAASVTVRSGETLSDIANRYGVSVGTLMRMNGIRNPDLVEAGSRLQVPGPTVKAGAGRHRVKSGETLSSIAGQYRVSGRDLMALNNLRNANHVEVGQTLRLPSNAVMPRPAFKPVAVTPISGATEHTVAKGQTLTQIAKAYKLPVASLISINQLSDPNKVEVGTRLYLTDPSLQKPLATQSQPVETQQIAIASTPVVTAKPVQTKPVQTKKPAPKAKPVQAAKPQQTLAKSADWRTYGPLQVDWANWQPMGGSQVVPTLNAKGQALYLAVNCSAKKINATGADGSWKVWEAPKNRFEKDLVKDRCQAKA
jgi:peptidoglycan endopeptidase LytE